MKQIAWCAGLISFVCAALLGQAELLGEPWRHYITVAAIVGTAVAGYMLQHPAPTWDGTERRGVPPTGASQ